MTDRKLWISLRLVKALSFMVRLGDLPRGILQVWASVNHGMWMVRSAEFLQTGRMDTVRWMRVIGDRIFAIGILGLARFELGLKGGWSLQSDAGNSTAAESGASSTKPN